MTSDCRDWIGRSEERSDVVTASVLDRFSALLDRGDPAHGEGDHLPPLAHWLFFLPRERQSELGEDGHAMRGGFLPPIHHLPRRMWAGSRLAFHAPLLVGQKIVRRSTISSIEEKEGGNGPLVFVTVRHEIGPRGASPAIVDEHDIVYRGLEAPSIKRDVPTAERGRWHRSLVPDPVLLFRYSALTFNGHRIHYDRDYVTGTENYPGLVVHGPLLATLLVDLLRRSAPAAFLTAFSFRAIAPLFDGSLIHLNGEPPDEDGIVRLWATDDSGRLAMKAEAKLATS